MKWISKILLVIILSCSVIFNCIAQTIYTIGDSTMSDKEYPDQNPERGWAQMLPQYLPDHIKVENHAVNGRSTRSFIEEGRWKIVKNKLREGDFVLIQFGHNDQKIKDPRRYTNPFTAYRDHLVKYITETQNQGATPVLLTSIVRRKFNENGTLIDTHGAYPQVVREIANNKKVQLIDLQLITERLEESYGIEGSKKLHLHFDAGEHSYYPDGIKDNTHLSELGASLIAESVAKELKRLKILNNDSTNNNALKIKNILSNITLPNIPNNKIILTDTGGRGDGITDNKNAFDNAIKKLHQMGGGQLIVPPGEYLVNGPIHLEDHIDLHIKDGATIHFGDDPDDYLPMVATSWEGTFINNYSPLIYAEGKSDIAITGNGTINGNGNKLWASWKAKEKESKLLSREMNHNHVDISNRNFGKGHFLRPHLLQLKDCNNILVQDVHITNSPFWCTHFLRSESITIKSISFDAHNKNNDGIDLEYASNVLIENVDFDNADDNIAIKAGRDDEGRANNHTPSENIVVRNCRIKGLHAFVIGSEMAAGVRHVYIDNCQASGYLKRGIYFKTNSDRGGYIRDIHISNITMDETEDCIFITANYHGEGSGEHASKISDIYIRNINCNLATGTGIMIEGYPTTKAEDIHLDHIRIKKATNALTLINTDNIIMNEIVIDRQAGTPTSVK